MLLSTVSRLINAFPLWIVLGSLLALFRPDWFIWFKPYISYGLMVIMLGMGLTLKADDFKRVLENPWYVGLAALLQYTVMPLLGWGIGLLFNLETGLAVGLILVACCPGGTASNVICYLARVDVALSVSMTAVSTLMAVIMTPLLTTWLIGNKVEVSAIGLLIGTARVVLVPVVLGILIGRFLPRFSAKITPFSPLLALAAIVMIIGAVIGGSRELLLESGLRLLLAVITLHLCGFGLGYLFTKFVIRDEVVSRTTSIEVGMQNSGLGVVLARENFAALAGVAAPSAIASSVQNIVGSLLVWVFRRWPAKPSAAQANDGN
jgi:BASS family bile acid:Na+ symporter